MEKFFKARHCLGSGTTRFYIMVTKAVELGLAVEYTVAGKIDHAQGTPCSLVRVVGFLVITLTRLVVPFGPL